MAAQVTMMVCAKSGEFTKSYSNFGTQRPFFFSVTVCNCSASLVSKMVFTPSRLKIYRTTESPCFEPSVSPLSLTSASR